MLGERGSISVQCFEFLIGVGREDEYDDGFLQIDGNADDEEELMPSDEERAHSPTTTAVECGCPCWCRLPTGASKEDPR